MMLKQSENPRPKSSFHSEFSQRKKVCAPVKKSARLDNACSWSVHPREALVEVAISSAAIWGLSVATNLPRPPICNTHDSIVDCLPNKPYGRKPECASVPLAAMMVTCDWL